MFKSIYGFWKNCSSIFFFILQSLVGKLIKAIQRKFSNQMFVLKRFGLFFVLWILSILITLKLLQVAQALSVFRSYCLYLANVDIFIRLNEPILVNMSTLCYYPISLSLFPFIDMVLFSMNHYYY